ncbi:hypothetical protein Zm00014a_027328 [Zea mays]|nr:hypothetical protein Zm00014a_013364 [Zea mays]PWZ56918.1 hypothetical protein Zm00014a_027328 [Zea mays]
MVGKIW